MHRKIDSLVLTILLSAAVLASGQRVSEPIPDNVKAQHRTLFSRYFSGTKNIEQETLDGHDVNTTVELDSYSITDPEAIKEARRNPYPNMNLRGVSCDADAVVVATPTSAEANTTADGGGLFTDYRFQVESVLKNTGATKLENSSIIVTRPGGQATINGRSVRVKINDFPLFVIGRRYLLFLGHLKATDTFEAFGVGSFELTNGSVAPFKANTFGQSSIPSLSNESAFLAEVRAAIAASCKRHFSPVLGKQPEGI
ncbi:MAG TPA: hypothetical protein VGM18_05580 [Candidatus Sulfotelmatobacter sp.]